MGAFWLVLIICEITWDCNPIKSTTWSVVNFKKSRDSSKLYTWACNTVIWYWSADTFFDSCQLTMKWISHIKLQTCNWPVNIYFLWVSFWATPSSNKYAHRLHPSPRYGQVIQVSGFLVLTAVNWHGYPMSFRWCNPLRNLKFSKLARLRSPYWYHSVVIRDSQHPQALPLAMLTMKKKRLGFIISMRGFRLFL